MGKQKNNCKVFTPPEVVCKMLDIIGYNKTLYGKKVLENSCGDGQFLIEIVTRYINVSRSEGYTDEQICRGLERDIYGFEIEEDIFRTCLCRLNELLAKCAIGKVNWNIQQSDALKTTPDTNFAYVIGNPPYITYSALSVANREYIKNTFAVCKRGKPDYYYAFIESAIEHMDDKGRLCYLIPSNFFKTQFAHDLRSYILPLLSDIYDYTDQKIFDSALTASAIIVCDKSYKMDKIRYHGVVNGKTSLISKGALTERWIFGSVTPAGDVAAQMTRFGDVFPASSSIATLYNDAFVIESGSDAHKTVEDKVLRTAVSPKSMSRKKSEYIIFPYYYNEDGTLQRYSEEEFNILFPCAVRHLTSYKTQLAARDSDKIAKWFEYGRSQAIAHLNQRKLLLSTLVTDKVKVYELDESVIPYSGIYIVAKPGYLLSDAKRILESDVFYDYAKKVGIPANGTSIRISIRDINDFRFTEQH
jgi:hypothetical protein